ncbi:MAG: hypothetical protein L3J44_02255 [Campylobacteraceae bacterium]|nr:hypothetical protein [Campylobacteraceae bacterium]
MRTLYVRAYLYYKFLNSLFLGLSVGSIFVLYTPLQPSIYSLGGIFLALGMLVLAKFYDKIMNLEFFFYITLFVEFVVLVFVASFLILNYSYVTALLVYTGYQITFVFGSYLVRMETIALKKTQIISYADIMKQKGYLIGLVLSYLFYKLLEYVGITSKQIQVYDLHVGLFILEIIIIIFIFRSFSKNAS